MHRIIVFITVVYLALAGIMFSCRLQADGLTKATLKVDWKIEVQFLGFIIAQEQGLYAREGLDITILDSPNMDKISEIPEQIATGVYDFGVGSGSLAAAQNKGIPVVALASIYQFSPSVIFALQESGIRSIRDIKGRSIAIKGGAWKELLVGFLEKVGMKLSDLKPVKVGYDMEPFFERKVDIWTGFITNEVALARLKRYKLVTFPLYEYGYSHLGAAIFTSRANIKQDSRLVQRFVRASIAGWTWAANHSQEAVNLFLEKYPEKKADAAFHHASFNASILLVRPPGSQVGAINCQTYLKGITFKYQEPDEFCTERFLNKSKRVNR